MDLGGIPAEAWGGEVAVQVAVLVAVASCMAWLGTFLSLIPSLTECIFRWKGNVNLEESVPRTRDRNNVAVALILPFCLVVSRFRVWPPEASASLGDFAHLLAVIAAFLGFILLRWLMRACLRPRRLHIERYGCATRCGRNYFIITCTSLLTIVGALALLGAEPLSIKKFCTTYILIGYTFFLLRKTEILISFCSPFKAFLYLCALEFAPTGALIGAAMLL